MILIIGVCVLVAVKGRQRARARRNNATNVGYQGNTVIVPPTPYYQAGPNVYPNAASYQYPTVPNPNPLPYPNMPNYEQPPPYGGNFSNLLNYKNKIK